MKQKIVISGHTNGIGKSFYDVILQQYYDKFDIVGYDSAEGKDLNDIEIVNNFINNCATADYIILNAYTTGYTQQSLLKDLYNCYKDQTKLCIAIGSLSTDRCVNEEIAQQTLGNLEYWYNKKELNVAVQNINSTNSNFKATVVKPGWVRTQFSQHLHAGPWVEPREVAEVLLHIILLQKTWFIPEFHVNVNRTKL